MARIRKPVVGTIGVSTIAQVVLDSGEPHAKGGLIRNTHATEVLYIGGATQDDVSSATGWPLDAGKSVYLEGDVDQSSGFYVAGTSGTTYAFLPTSRA